MLGPQFAGIPQTQSKQVTFRLFHQVILNQEVYLKFRIAKQNQEFSSIKMDLVFESQKTSYCKQIAIATDSLYEYSYELKNEEQIEKENRIRQFCYHQNGKMQIDIWNQIGVHYQILPRNLEFFTQCQVSILCDTHEILLKTNSLRNGNEAEELIPVENINITRSFVFKLLNSGLSQQSLPIHVFNQKKYQMNQIAITFDSSFLDIRNLSQEFRGVIFSYFPGQNMQLLPNPLVSQNYNEEFQRTKSELEKSCTKIKILEQELKEKETKNQIVQMQIQSSNKSQYEQLNKELIQIKSQLQHQQDLNQQLSKDKQLVEYQLKLREQELLKIQGQAQAFEQELTEAKKKIQQQQQTILENEQQVQQSQIVIQNIQQFLRLKDGDIGKLKNQVNYLNSSLLINQQKSKEQKEKSALEIAKMQVQNGNLQSQVKQLNEVNKDLENLKQNELNLQKKRAQEEILQYKSALEQANRQLFELQQQKVQRANLSDNSIQVLQNEMSNRFPKEMDVLKDTIKHYEEKMEKIKNEQRQFAQQYDSSIVEKNKMSDMLKLITQKEQEYNDCLETINQYEIKLQQIINKNNQQLIDYQETINEQQSKIKQLHANQKDYIETNNEEHQKVKDLLEERKAYLEVIKRLSAQVKKQKEEIKNHIEAYKQIAQQLQEQIRKNQELEIQLCSDQKNFEEQQKKIKNQFSQVQQQYQNKMDQITQESERQKQELGQMQEKNKKQQEKQEKQRLEQETKFREQQSQVEERLQELEQENQQNKTELSSTSFQLQSKKSELESKQKRVQELEDQKLMIEKHLQNLQNEYEEKIQKHQDEIHQLNEDKISIQQLQKDQQQINENNEEIQILNFRISEYEIQIQEQRQFIDQIQEKNTINLEKLKEEQENELHELQQELQQKYQTELISKNKQLLFYTQRIQWLEQEKQKLEQETKFLRELKEQQSQVEERLQELEQENQQYQTEFISQSFQLQSKISEQENIQKRVEELEDQKLMTEKHLQNLQNEYEEKIQKHQDEIHQLNEDQISIQQLQKDQQQINENNEEIQILNIRIREQEIQIQEQRQFIDQIQEKNNINLEKLIEEQENKLHELTESQFQAQQELQQEYQTELTSMNQQLKFYSSRISELEYDGQNRKKEYEQMIENDKAEIHQLQQEKIQVQIYLQATEYQANNNNKQIQTLNAKISEYERDIIQLKDENQQSVENQEQQIKTIKLKYKSLQEERDDLETKFKLQMIDNDDYSTKQGKLKAKISQLYEQIGQLKQELEELQNKLDQDDSSKLQDKIIKLTRELQSLNSKFNAQQEENKNLEEQLDSVKKEQRKEQKLKSQFMQLTSEMRVLECQIASTQNELTRKTEEYQSLLQQYQQQQQQITEKDIVQNQIQKSLKELNYQLDQKAKELIASQKEIEVLTGKSNQSDLNLQKITGQLKQEHTKYEAQLRENTSLKEQLQSVQTQAQEYSKQMKVQMDQVVADMEKQKNESQYKDLVIKKIKEHFQEKYVDKVVGTMDKIMNSEFKINNFTADPNSQRDQTEYDVFEILIDQPKAKQLIKQSKWISFDECLQTNPLGNTKTTRSIQPNVDITFVKGYLTQVDEAQNAELKGKRFLRKELKSQESPMFNKKEEAAKLSVNNFMCKLLLDQYNSDLDSCKLLSLREIRIQRQFVFQVKGKEEYFYCEMIEEGPYEKINGGQFVMKNSETHQYLNAFSLYTYHLMKRQLIISNLQVAGNYLYDMIVSTEQQIFSSIDQGQSEIVNTIGVLEKASKDNLGKCWNEQLEKKAKEGQI